MSKKAFTLIELLVVIAIIAILAAILFPVFAQAKAAAKKTSALSDTKQQDLGQLMYSNDSDDLFAPVMDNANPTVLDGYNSFSYTWQNLCQPYIKNWALFLDPGATWTHPDPVHYIDPFLSFGMPMTANASTAASAIGGFGDTYYSYGTPVKFSGVGGAENDLSFWGGRAGFVNPGVTPTEGAPSLSSTTVARPADTVLISESSSPDMWTTYGMSALTDYSNVEMFAYCWTFGFSQYDSNPGGLNGYRAGGTARWNFAPSNGSAAGTTCTLSRWDGGQIVTAFTDGHAKSLQEREYYRVDTIGGQKVYTHLWPSG